MSYRVSVISIDDDDGDDDIDTSRELGQRPRAQLETKSERDYGADAAACSALYAWRKVPSRPRT